MKIFIAKLILLGIVLSISACASVPMAPASFDQTAKQFAPVADKANLYIYRNESMGAAIAMGIYINELPIGQTAAKTYLNLQLDPGTHKIRGHAENNSEVSLDAKAGENYYIWQEVKIGLGSARNKLQLVDTATGQAGVRECKLTSAGQSK